MSTLALIVSSDTPRPDQIFAQLPKLNLWRDSSLAIEGVLDSWLEGTLAYHKALREILEGYGVRLASLALGDVLPDQAD